MDVSGNLIQHVPRPAPGASVRMQYLATTTRRLYVAIDERTTGSWGYTFNLPTNAKCTVGTAGSDLLIGGDVHNHMLAGAGGDCLDGKGGNDTLFGGMGADILEGNSGFDFADFFRAVCG